MFVTLVSHAVSFLVCLYVTLVSRALFLSFPVCLFVFCASILSTVSSLLLWTVSFRHVTEKEEPVTSAIAQRNLGI